jgi:hypothetical protein
MPKWNNGVHKQWRFGAKDMVWRCGYSRFSTHSKDVCHYGLFYNIFKIYFIIFLKTTITKPHMM